MKRIIVFILLLYLVFSGFSKSNGEKVICSEAHYKYGHKAIEISDNYLNYVINSEEAYNLLDELYAEHIALPKTNVGDQTHSTDFSIESNVLSLHSKMLSLSYGYGNYNDVKSITEELRNTIESVDSYIVIVN